jgi:hypothetical protein
MTVEESFSSFTSRFEFIISQDSVMSGIVGWFDVEMLPEFWFSTSPSDASTHWEHTLFQLSSERPVSKGSLVKGGIRCKPIDTDHRGLDIRITIDGDEEN